MMKVLAQVVLAGLAASVATGSAAKTVSPGGPVVVVDTGTVRGTADGDLLSFKGLPYAAPPIGPLRWAPPEKAASWTGIRAASNYGPACLQKMNADGKPNAGGVTGPTSEDCLSLNVWTPKGAKKAPVMVWIYGGGNAYGAGSVGAYDGSAFARDGVVLVTFNYRLGTFGFFAHPEVTKAAGDGAPLANDALLDQRAALQWVQRNIAAFGGDPANVTVFGESAGGMDILALMTMPSAKGLFAKAIVESGGGWWPAVSLATREAEGVKTVTRAGAPAGASLAQLRALPAAALLAASGEGYLPATDGRLLTLSPREAFATGQVAKVPLIIGSNSYEASLLAEFKLPAAVLAAIAPAPLKAAYTDTKTADDLGESVFGDAVMGAPARWVASKASGHPAWLYHFSYVIDAKRATAKGADHAAEIPFVFDSWEHLGVLGQGLPVSDRDRAVSKVIHSCWVGFARTGAPVCTGGPAWPAYVGSDDSLMEFADKTRVARQFRKAQYDAQEAHPLPTLDPGLLDPGK
ncbi:carboxylesterase/lipase family protein [Sphingomonas sp. ERG5]|uniref:carboxylesterase/lipase family protein n=1 Tax=Sphingomonas sp. ERG5 TaxID=1381597 RepID=UPI00068EECCB|nr:carboxylesterase family protein [Sphingomonas sp. ERG5]